MKKLTLLLLLMPLMLHAQNFRGLDQSPMDQAKFPTSNRVTEKVAIITDSRPQLTNRSFDDIVPKNKVWRTGANEATELRLFNDIEINNKTIFRFDAINITLGLKYLRLSPDHGTAKNIIGKNKANPLSLLKCIKIMV